MTDSITPASVAVTIPSATFSRTARARTSLSTSALLSSMIDSTESSSCCERMTSFMNVETFARRTAARTGVNTKSTAPLA